ncbi:MAG: PaaI family thioesterase [Acidobacteria bacterium]|nr:PaaI family thioesterase [Acidobacteriota bacterium]
MLDCTSSSETEKTLSIRDRAALGRLAIADLIGFRMTDIGDGRAVALLRAGPQHANLLGTLHGGVLCDITDAAMGLAFATTVEPHQSFTTTELKINFFRPVWKGHLRAEARVVHRGRSLGYLECEVKNEEGKLIAKANSTCLILEGEKAVGR